VGGAGKKHRFEFGGPGAIWLGRFERLTSNNPPYFRRICQSVQRNARQTLCGEVVLETGYVSGARSGDAETLTLFYILAVPCSLYLQGS
jgi:hypothetical protein